MTPGHAPLSSVYLDTNVLIYGFESGNRWAATLRPLFRRIEDNETVAVISELSLAEVLVRPYAENTGELIALFESVLSGQDRIQVLPIDRTVLRSAARLRARLRLKLADAIHVATALAAETRWFVSNDASLLRLLPPPLSGLPIAQIAQ